MYYIIKIEDEVERRLREFFLKVRVAVVFVGY